MIPEQCAITPMSCRESLLLICCAKVGGGVGAGVGVEDTKSSFRLVRLAGFRTALARGPGTSCCRARTWVRARAVSLVIQRIVGSALPRPDETGSQISFGTRNAICAILQTTTRLPIQSVPPTGSGWWAPGSGICKEQLSFHPDLHFGRTCVTQNTSRPPYPRLVGRMD